MDGEVEWFSWLVVAILIILLIECWARNRGLPPGPWGLPFFGYYFFINSAKPYITFAELNKKYGEIFSFRTVGGTLFVVLNSTSLMKEAFVSRADEFIGRPVTQNFLNWIDDGYGLVQTEGDVWKEQKRFFLSASKQHGFGKTDMEGFIHSLIQDMLKDFRKLCKEPISLPFHVSHVTGNIISRILCGKSIPKNDPKFLELNARNYDFVLYFADRRFLLVGAVFDYIMLTLTADGRQMKVAKKVLDEYATELVEEHIRNFDPSHPKDFIDSYLLHLRKLEKSGQLHNSSFSLTRLKKVFLTMYLEATETVSSTTCSLLTELAKYPDVQHRAQKELDEVVGRNRLPSWTDKKNLPYVDAMIMELYRISIVFFIGPYYSNFEETTLRGYRIPKRSFIISNFYAAHVNPDVYPNPFKFDPGRYVGEDGQRVKQEPPLPFGIGKRSCVGESLAAMEVFLIITAILQTFTLYPANGEKVKLESRFES